MTDQNAPTDLFAAHRIDAKASQDGVWITIRGDKFRVARMGNDRTKLERAAFLAEHGLAPSADIPPHLQDAWVRRMFGRCLLVDVKFAAHPKVVYTPELGESIWGDPSMEDLVADILARARGDWTIASLKREGLLGNSEPCSNGSASAATGPTR